MGKTILLSDLLGLISTDTDILIRDEYYTLLFVGTKNDERINEYKDKLILEICPWNETKLCVRIINNVY